MHHHVLVMARVLVNGNEKVLQKCYIFMTASRWLSVGTNLVTRRLAVYSQSF
jgi:hypothetical protein